MDHFFPIDLQTRFGDLHERVSLPEAPMRLAEFASVLMPVADRINLLASDMAVMDGETKISCGPGCGACCRQAVPISIPEAFWLHDVIENQPLPKRNEIIQRFTTIHSRLDQANLNIRRLSDETQDAQWMRFSTRYFSLGMACPFLENESCSIYAQRPTVCRDFLVTSPPEECQDTTSEKMVCIDSVVNLSHCLAKLAAIVFDTEPQIMPMPLALEWVAAHPEWNQRRFDPQLLFSTLFEMVKSHVDSERNL